MRNSLDTICAIATANGVGAIGMIRVSGSNSYQLVGKLLNKSLEKYNSHTAHFGTIKGLGGEVIDEVLVTIFEEGKSFTGEQSVEITCHGSGYILQRIVDILIKTGCRLAEPGEYTQRAFLNGRMDLSQAEAVADLIASQSKSAHRIAINQLKGGFSSELKILREKLIHFASLVELELDFSEEDVEFADRSELNSLVKESLEYTRKLARSFELGNAIKKGVPVAIVGAPNTGKSTLLNNLLTEDRAIVSNIAGTTRDVIEETLNIEGILFRLIDTAGIREGADEIESMGIERSKLMIAKASIVLFLADATQEETLIETQNWFENLKIQYPNKHFLLVVNKNDVKNVEFGDISISAKQGVNIEALKSKLVTLTKGEFDLNDDIIVSNARHFQALEKTSEALEKAHQGLNTGVTGDFVAMDIRQAMYELGTITGDISTDDLLGNIFSKFCIGK